MGKVQKQTSTAKAKGKRVLRPNPNSSKVTKSTVSKKGKEPLRTVGASSSSSSSNQLNTTSGRSTRSIDNTASKQKSIARRAQVLSDEESEEESQEEDEEEDDPDHQLGLRPTLRVVSKAAVRRTWKPVSVKTRTHIQTLVSNLFPAAITRARGDKRKIAVQASLSRLMQKVNDRLSELDVPPPPGRERINYSQLMNRKKDLEAMLVPDLEHIRDLELRLEQEQILAKQDEEQLENFREKKKELDIRTGRLQRNKLHSLLRDRDDTLRTAMTNLCEPEKDFSHLSAADRRLLSMMSLSREEDFSNADVHDTMYNVIPSLRGELSVYLISDILIKIRK
ncbi:hypothetical protein BGZ76_011836 [Entomortierella beljakovae]|nr:hypothetical protein BGZ76_011836 [Entomortierella beljakovae]